MSRIVVVEDDPIVREYVVRCLGSRGYQAVIAENGEDGLTKVLEAETAMVITDIRMPGLDGFGLADAIRRAPGIVQPDIVFISSSEERNLYRRALQLGASDFLTKPFTCKDISETVSARLAKRSADTVPLRALPRHDEGALPQVEGYRVIRRLSHGASSQVLLVAPQNSDAMHALKMLKLPEQVFEQREVINRFLAEYAMLAGLSHPNVAKVYAQGISEDYLYLDLEYLPGGDLRLDIKTGMTLPTVKQRAAELASALMAIHAAGIVHRDLKPANVLMRMTGEAVVADFGIAKQLESGLALTQLDIAVGTPYYMSPEQAMANPIDARSDLYALGAVMFEMVTGEPPFNGEIGREVLAQHLVAPVPRLPEVAAAFQPVIDRLLAKAPADRYQSAAEAREAILAIEI